MKTVRFRLVRARRARRYVCAVACLCMLALPVWRAEAETPCNSVEAVVAGDQVKKIVQGDKLTIFMGREARNITVDWGEGTNCEFDIQISCGHGTFDSVLSGKAKGAGKQTYSFVRTTVEELRIVVLKGSGTVKNMETLSTKADDNESYNPV
jgi:hypothetical protein